MKTIEINTNDKAKVILTPEGNAHYLKYFSNIAARQGVKLRTVYIPLKPDSYGWVEFPFRHLMRIFGDQRGDGNPRQMFVDNVIVIKQ